MKKFLCFCITFHLLIGHGQSVLDSLDTQLTEWAGENLLPGFAAVIVGSDKIHYQKGFGFADIENQTPYSPQTIQNIGSVSKTFIGISLLKAVELGKLELDDPVNDHLPFKVINPFHPSVPITIRHLATHTSSLKDTKLYDRSYLLRESSNIQKGEVSKSTFKTLQQYAVHDEIEMGKLLKNMYSVDGAWYRKKNFLKTAPGTKYEYSNLGATLAAHVLEQVTGMSFSAFTQKYILEPLNMKASGWSFGDVEMGNHAQLYTEQQVPLPKYTLISYPDGGMLTSVEDMAKYLQELIRGQAGNGKLIGPESYQEIMRPQFEDKEEISGIFMAISGIGFIGHTGGDPGIVTVMYFSPEDQVGAFLMTNCDLGQKGALPQFQKIWTTIRGTFGKL